MLGIAAACSDGDPESKPAGDASADGPVDSGADAQADVDASDADPGWPVISASSSTLFETETHLARAPDGALLATWIGVTASGVTHTGWAISPDAGATWSSPALLMAPGGRHSVDPVPFADDSGAFHLAFVGLKRDAQGNPFDMRIYVATAGPGQSTFSAPVDASGPVPGDDLDKPWGTSDAAGRLFVTWTDNAASEKRISVSSDGGASFSTLDVGTDPGSLLYPCVDRANDQLHVVFWVNQAIGHALSTDHGGSWSVTHQVSLTSDDPAMFDDPTCVADAGELWIAYGVGTDSWSAGSSPRSTRIRLAHSSDGGQTFERFSAEDPSSGTRFLHPALARDASGRLSLLYYAGSDTSPDPLGSLRLGESQTGETFGTSSVVQSPITFTRERPVPIWLGDYIGLSSDGTERIGTFADNASGQSHIRFFRAP